MGRSYTETDVMLTHALVTYFGYEEIASQDVKRAVLAQKMEDGLGRLGPTKNGWDIVWGPAGFRAPFLPFDSAAMYVAQSRIKPSRFVVAVRGTNPVSLYDWALGDLAVTRQVPWSYNDKAAAAGAKISFSSAFGLSVLQHLRWEPAESSSTPLHLLRAIEKKVTDGLGGVARRLEQRLSTVKSDNLKRLRAAIQTDLSGIKKIVDGELPAKADDVLQLLYERRTSWSQSSLGKSLDEAMDGLEDTRLDPFRLVAGGSELRRLFASGIDLQAFLAAAIADAEEPVEIFVTGHSKGGALSSTLALWLADTQGSDGVSDDDRWDPDRKATVHAYSFAGPTAGNSAFAAHSDAVIGPRCHRVVNRLDIVPHAWAIEDLQKVPELYDEPVHRPEILRTLVRELDQDVASLDYRHIGNDIIELPGVVDEGKPWFVTQAVHQHLDGYLEQLGLADEMNQDTFFSPRG